MKNLKDLTPEECVAIAKIINPNVDWKFTISKYKWEGFDVVDDVEDPTYIVQIDLKEGIGFAFRFRLFEYLDPMQISYEKLNVIRHYLKTIEQKSEIETQNEVSLRLFGSTILERKTIQGDPCNLCLKVVDRSDIEDSKALLITKEVTTRNKEKFVSDGSWNLLKESENGECLFRQNFSIKLSTLKEISTWVESLKLF